MENMKAQAPSNKATSTATELHIMDLFEEVGRFIYVFRREYEEWALGHRTDQELGATEHQFAEAIRDLNDHFEAEVAAHRAARRATRARYLAEQQKADQAADVAGCDRCGQRWAPYDMQNIGVAPADNYYVCPVCRQEIGALLAPKKYSTIGDLTLKLGPISPAQRIAERLKEYARQVEEAQATAHATGFYPPTPPVDTTSTEPPTTTDVKRPNRIFTHTFNADGSHTVEERPGPDTFEEFVQEVNKGYGAMVDRGLGLRQARPSDDRTTWPLLALMVCPCADCQAEVKRRKATAQDRLDRAKLGNLGDWADSLNGVLSALMGVPADMVYGPEEPSTEPVHDEGEEGREPTHFNPYEERMPF